MYSFKELLLTKLNDNIDKKELLAITITIE